VDQVIDLPKNGNPSLKFLDQCPGDVIVCRSDTEQVERNSYLEDTWGLSSKGKRGFLSQTIAALAKTINNLKRSTY